MPYISGHGWLFDKMFQDVRLSRDGRFWWLLLSVTQQMTLIHLSLPDPAFENRSGHFFHSHTHNEDIHVPTDNPS